MTREEAENLLADVLIAKDNYEHTWAINSDENSKAVAEASDKWDAQRERLLQALTSEEITMDCNNPSIRELINSTLDAQGNLDKTIQKILREEGYTGLVNLENDECGCPIDSLFLCGARCYNADECRAGYLHKDGKIYLEEETEENNKCHSH